MNFRNYLDFDALLHLGQLSQEDNRLFGMKPNVGSTSPIQQLLAWTHHFKHKLPTPLLSDTFSSMLYRMTFMLVLLSFLMGVLCGGALLSYNGKEPVNVVYFIAVAVVVPFLTMILALFAMGRAQSPHNLLVHLSPAFWMEKILGFLPNKQREDLRGFSLSSLLVNWLTIERSQWLAFVFSLGLLVALLVTVTTKDIAFAWSSTLHIQSQTLHALLHTVSFPWREFIPSAVPSLELIEQSRYYRLGDTLTKEMVGNASILGEWWPFLACATVFYALLLRLMMVGVASFGLKRALKHSFLGLEGSAMLLSEINTPLVTSVASDKESEFHENGTIGKNSISVLDALYDVVLGWAMDTDALRLVCDSMGVVADKTLEVGGMRSLEQDSGAILQSRGKVLCFVKAWEPPTMDFVDFLTELIPVANRVTIAPVGTVEMGYKASTQHLDIWDRKLAQLSYDKVWFKR